MNYNVFILPANHFGQGHEKGRKQMRVVFYDIETVCDVVVFQ